MRAVVVTFGSLHYAPFFTDAPLLGMFSSWRCGPHMWSGGRLSTWQLECGDSLESFSRQSSKVLTHLGYQVPPEADEVQDPVFAWVELSWRMRARCACRYESPARTIGAIPGLFCVAVGVFLRAFPFSWQTAVDCARLGLGNHSFAHVSQPCQCSESVSVVLCAHFIIQRTRVGSS